MQELPNANARVLPARRGSVLGLRAVGALSAGLMVVPLARVVAAAVSAMAHSHANANSTGGRFDQIAAALNSGLQQTVVSGGFTDAVPRLIVVLGAGLSLFLMFGGGRLFWRVLRRFPR